MARHCLAGSDAMCTQYDAALVAAGRRHFEEALQATTDETIPDKILPDGDGFLFLASF